MKKKLTLVSIIFQGRTESRFVMVDADESGKVSIPSLYIDQMVESAGGFAQGSTFTLG